MTSKAEANGQAHAITRRPLLPLDRAVRHVGRAGKCESHTMSCNAERAVRGLPDCIAVPVRLGGVFTLLWR